MNSALPRAVSASKEARNAARMSGKLRAPQVALRRHLSSPTNLV
jgi:hypothetical protein